MLDSYFTRRGYLVLRAFSGAEAVRLAETRAGRDTAGRGACRTWTGWRSAGRIRAYVFLPHRVPHGAGGGARTRSSGFAAGGDDYVVKPFSIDELGARVAAHLRREKRHAAAAELRFDGDLVINYSDRTASLAGRDVGLARREFDILEFLSQNPGLVFDKERIYEGVWGIDGEGDSTVVVEHIRRIRVKLAAAGAQRTYIETVWGVGYKWAK